jgi:hypothetical protein
MLDLTAASNNFLGKYSDVELELFADRVGYLYLGSYAFGFKAEFITEKFLC